MSSKITNSWAIGHSWKFRGIIVELLSTRSLLWRQFAVVCLKLAIFCPLPI